MKVKDVKLEPPVTISPNARISDLYELFQKTKAWAIYVVNADDEPIGVITQLDLRTRFAKKSDPVSKIMSVGVYSVDINVDIKKAKQMLYTYRIGTLAVTDGGKICGVLTRYNVFKTPEHQNTSNISKNIFGKILLGLLLVGVFFVLVNIYNLHNIISNLVTNNINILELCPPHYYFSNGSCIESPKCNDGTYYLECSKQQPFYCLNGTLVENATLCGCPFGFKAVNNTCVDQFKTYPKEAYFPFTLNGQDYILNVTLYGGLNDYLSTQEGYIYRFPSGYTPSKEEIESAVAHQVIDEPNQDRIIEEVITAIKNFTPNKDDQARIAISLVQNIPYDWDYFYSKMRNQKYPYQVLYSNSGVCGEKSKLLALLLKKLGYGVVLLEYSYQNHEAVGIKCSKQSNMENMDYCFIETTRPTIITYVPDTYVNVGRLTEVTNIILVSDGLTFDVSKEYEDGLEYKRLEKLFQNNSKASYPNDYQKWLYLRKKYGLEEKECTEPNTYLCNGECWVGCGPYELWKCTPLGGVCELDPNNCPPGTRSCIGKCWSDCPPDLRPVCTATGLVCYS